MNLIRYPATINPNKLTLDIGDIFTYNKKFPEDSIRDGMIYYDCTLLENLGSFKVGDIVHIYISIHNGKYVMRVGCDTLGYGGKAFTPGWIQLDLADDSSSSWDLDDDSST
jgi:hypothetical protein